MAKKYIIPIEADPSALKKGVAEANAVLTDLGNNKVMVEIDYEHGDIEDIRNAVKALTDYSPEIKVQLDYDLFNATLKQKQKELANNKPLYDMILGEKSGGGQLSDRVSDILKEVEEGLFQGLSKKELEPKMKEAMDLAASFQKLTKKDIDAGTLDYMEELQENFKGLDDYEPRSDLFTSVIQDVEKATTIVDGLKLQIEDLKLKGAKDTDIIDVSEIKKSSQEIETVTSKLEDISKIKTVSIFDGVSEQVYDVEKDIDKLTSKLEEMASKMQIPVFQSGDLRKEVVNSRNFKPADSLGVNLSRGEGYSVGTGQYFASNLIDIIEWGKEHSDGFPRGLFAYDLGKVQKDLLSIPDTDYFTGLIDLFGNIHNLISKGIAEIPETSLSDAEKDTHKTYEELLGGKNVEDIYDEYKRYFNDFGVSVSDFKSFINNQRNDLQQLANESKDFDDLLTKVSKEDAYGTKFLKRFTNYKGIDVTNLDGDDSSATGNLVFSVNSKQPYDINFNGNEDIARQFYNMVLSKILSNKAKNLDVDSDKLLSDFTDKKQLELLGDSGQSKIQEQIRKMAQEARSLSFEELNQTTSTKVVDEYISKLERLQQLQNTINNMKPEAASGKSWEEAGQHIEKLNAQYKQTISEIENLRKVDDGSQEIKEQIGLLENLAVAYRAAIDASIPNDVHPGDWISKYTNIPKGELWGDEATFQYSKIKKSAGEFRQEVDRGILDIYRTQNIDLSNVSQEKVDTSALSEIPAIMERITSAGKEATQTMDQFHASANGEGTGGVGSTTDSEVDSLREQLKQAEADADAESKRASDLEDRLDSANEELRGYDETNGRLSAELEEARKNAAAEQNADKERIRNLEAELSLKDDLYSASVEDQVEADKRASQYEELNKELQQRVDDLEKQQSSAGDNKGVSDFQNANAGFGETTSSTTSQIDDETEAMYRLGAAALTAASNKDILENKEVTLKSATSNTVSALEKEAEVLERIAEAAGRIPSNINNIKSQQTKSSEKKKQETKDDTKSQLEKQYQQQVSKFSDLENYINSSKLLSSKYSGGLDALRNVMNNTKSDNQDSITNFANELQKLESTAKETAASVKNEVKSISDAYSNLYRHRNDIYTAFENGTKVNNFAPFQQYLEQTTQLEARVNSLKSTYGELAPEVQSAMSAMSKYQTDMDQFFRNQIETQISNSVDKIQKAMTTRKNQGSGYIAEYREELEKTLLALNEMQARLKSGDILDATNIRAYVEGLNQARQTMKGLTDQSKILATQSDVSKLLGKVTKDIESGRLSGDTLKGYLELQESLRGIISYAESAADGLTNVTKAAEQINVEKFNKLHEARIANGMDRPSFMNQFKSAITNQSAQFLGQYFSLQDFVRYGRELAQTVISIDTGMTELRKVSGETDSRLDQSFKASAASAKEYGATITDIIKSTADWSRLGYNIDQAEQLAKVTQLYQNVGDNMTQENASEYLVSTLQGFQMEASEAENVVDRINEVANNYAIDTAGRYARVA